MMRDIKVRDPNAGKRKRIPIDPALRQANMIKRDNAIARDHAQQHDDRDPDMIHHFRISARLEEERIKNVLPSMS